MTLFKAFNRTAALAALVAGVTLSYAPAYAAAPDVRPADKEMKQLTRAELLKVRPGDIAVGSEDAPVLMIEYASLSCSHCASFHKESFDKIKENYIDTGKVRFVLRDFPLNRPAVLGSILARCAPEDQFYTYVSALFASQGEWLSGDAKEKLRAIADMGGLGKEKYNACLEEKERTDAILESRFNAIKSLSIRSTPTFYINGITYEGAKNYEFFAGVLDKLLADADKKSGSAAKKDMPEKEEESDIKDAPAETPAKDAPETAPEAASDEKTEDEAGGDTSGAAPEKDKTLTDKIVDKVKETAGEVKKTLKEGLPGDAEPVEAAAPEKAE